MKTHHCLSLAFLLLFAMVLLVPADDEKETTPTLRVLTHNVYMGFSRGNAGHHESWREWIANQKPDVVSLQELNGYTSEKLAADAATWGHTHSLLLKEDGFPVGLTSRWPIEEVARLRDGFHHGMIRGRIRGIYFYAIHFHPSNWERRIEEAALLADDIASLPESNPAVVLAGDFNGFSPADREYYEATPSLIPFFKGLDQRNREARNLREGAIDYGGIQAILDRGFVDLQSHFRKPGAAFLGTFPSALVRKEDHGPDRRLDYVFVSENLVARVRAFALLRDGETALFSDHFPLCAEILTGAKEAGRP